MSRVSCVGVFQPIRASSHSTILAFVNLGLKLPVALAIATLVVLFISHVSYSSRRRRVASGSTLWL